MNKYQQEAAVKEMRRQFNEVKFRLLRIKGADMGVIKLNLACIEGVINYMEEALNDKE